VRITNSINQVVALAIYITLVFTPVATSAGDQDLAKAAQNPVAAMISLPFQNNTSFGVGAFDGTQNVMNIQPVIPVKLNDDWNLINRVILPYISLPTGPGTSVNGIGDTTYTAFFSPAQPGEWIWGIGPVFLLPTATENTLGSDKWGIGPSAVALKMPGRWVIGALVNNIWSVAGDGANDVNQFLLQYFVNYNFDKGWYAVSAPIITANWNATGEKWTIPFGGGFGRIVKFGSQPVNLSAHAYYNAVKPTNAGDWSLRLQAQFLFPR
jgi:hypothetical protein